MTDLQVFENEEFGSVRTLEIDDEVWFVGKDVAQALGYSVTRKAIRDHVDDEDVRVIQIGSTSGKQDTLLINESDMYSLILSSKLDPAKRFKRWVTSEILPFIRKTGSYTVHKKEPPEEELSAAVEMQKAAMLLRAAEHKAIPKGEQLKLLNMAVKILTGKELDFSTSQEEQLKNDGRYGMWLRVSTPQGEAREFVYKQSAIRKYKAEVNGAC